MPPSKIYNWNAAKNQLLIEERGISFERIVFEISLGNELDLVVHPNQDKYPGQMISMVEVDDYVYAVPFIETESEIFLKTSFPAAKPPGNTGTSHEKKDPLRRRRTGHSASPGCGLAQACQ